MTTNQLGRELLETPDIEVGYFDGEGHWLKASGLRRIQVDEHDWHPFEWRGEKPFGRLRWVMEIESNGNSE